MEIDPAKREALAQGRVPMLRTRPRRPARPERRVRPAAVHRLLRRGRGVRRPPLRLRRHAPAAREPGRRREPGRGRDRGTRAPPRPASAGRRQVDGPGRHRRADGANGSPTLAPAGGEAMLAWNPEFLREGYAVRGHAAPRPDRDRASSDSRAEKLLRDFYAADDRRRARRSWSPTTRPPSWSRSPPTPSWPPRSRSSTRWPRSARPPAPTSSTSPTRSGTTRASAAGSSTPASASAAAACPRTSAPSSTVPASSASRTR